MSCKMRCISNTICEKNVYVRTCLCWNMHKKMSRIHQKMVKGGCSGEENQWLETGMEGRCTFYCEPMLNALPCACIPIQK